MGCASSASATTPPKAAEAPTPGSNGPPAAGITQTSQEVAKNTNGVSRGAAESAPNGSSHGVVPGPGGHEAPCSGNGAKFLERLVHEHDHGGHRGNVGNARIVRHKAVHEVYTVDRGLGSGSSGVVREVTHRTSGRKAAMKSLSLDKVSEKKLELLFNEVSVYLSLDHPNICKLLEVYQDDQTIHLLMELCNGKELYDRLAAKRRYSEKDCAFATRQMLDALSYMHHHDVCHRDLKLENWVYHDESEEAKLKLIDFGFSKHFNAGIPMTAMHGTVYYVAPEVMEACGYDYKCDVWGIGVIVYMLLSGAPPFNGTDDIETIEKVKLAKFDFEGRRWAGISDLAKDFITALLEKDPQKRPTAKESMVLPWIQACLGTSTEHDKPIDLDVLRSMKQFASFNVLKRAALGLVAYSMTTDEMDNLEREFRKMDRNQKGTISVTDLTKALREGLNMSEEECAVVFDQMDLTGYHEIHYSEFVAAAIQEKFMSNENLIREAFSRFDIDNTGLISAENLRQVLGDEVTGTKVEDIIAEIDVKNDGKGIDYEEFVSALMELKPKDADDEDFCIVRKVSRQLIDVSRESSNEDMSKIGANKRAGVPNFNDSI